MTEKVESEEQPFVKLPSRPALPRQRLRVPYKLIEKQTLCRIINNYQTFTYENGKPSPGILSRTKWTNVVNDYNSCFPERRRNQKQLRKCWENLKNRGLQNSPLYSQFLRRPPPIVSQAFATSTTKIRVVDEPRPSSSYQPGTSSSRIQLNQESFNMVHGKGSTNANRSSEQPHNFSTHNGYISSSQQGRTYTSTDLNVPTSQSPPVSRRSDFDLLHQRQNTIRNRSRPYPTTGSTASRSSSSPDHVKNDDEKALRIKLLRSQILRVRQQMRQAEAVHDVTMRVLRTKASWFDKQINEIDSKRTVTVSTEFIRNDDKDCLNVPSFESEYDDLMSLP